MNMTKHVKVSIVVTSSVRSGNITEVTSSTNAVLANEELDEILNGVYHPLSYIDLPEEIQDLIVYKNMDYSGYSHDRKYEFYHTYIVAECEV